MPSLLVVDDEANIRTSLAGALSREGYTVDGAATLAEARTRLAESYDFVLLDVWFPEGSGLDLLAEIHAAAPETTVIVMSGHATLEAAVRATRLGAYDFLEKPIGLERLLVLLRNAGAALTLKADKRRLEAPWSAPLKGDSPAMRRLFQRIALAGPSPARVLIHGENGTGKELVARALHAASPRREMPFVAVNGAAIPEELIESELFGHEKGAFTGATESRRGRFEEAQGGTLFLDEVGDLSARAQTKLLRVLQENELTRVGGHRVIRVDVRVIAATHRDLAALIEAKAFREDLFFRLAVIPIEVPPLRERAADLPELVRHFAHALAREIGRPAPAFDAAALERLARHPFPGNIRELRNLVERLIILHPGPRIGAAEIEAALPRSAEVPAERSLADAVSAFERAEIERALEAEGGHVTRAARRLGIERSHLYKKMKQLGMRGGNAD